MESQTISVLYQTESYDVDYTRLHELSNKFRELIQPYLGQGVEPKNLQLRILYDKFAPRNVRNFIKMIQKQRNDVHSNEIAEMCEIAKLFQIESLYNKSLTYVRNQIDHNFNVFNDFDESNGQKYLELSLSAGISPQNSYNSSNISLNSTNSSIYQTSTSNNIITNNDINMSQSQENLLPTSVPVAHNTIYKVQVLNPLLKCCRYFFSKEGQILFTAKKKSNEIYIANGNDIHIKKGKSTDNCSRIMQCDGYNTVTTNDQEFKVTYVPVGVKNPLLPQQYSIEVSFLHEGNNSFWTPRQIDGYLKGASDHVPVQSRRNALLQNKDGVPTFAVRKMNNDNFEIECLSTVNPLIAFTIGLSQIVGPYD